MKLLNAIVSASLLAILLAACQQKDAASTFPTPPPPPKANYALAEQTAQGLTLTYDTRVDILLIVDDSRSMHAHQENLSKNIQSFVDGFAKTKAIDFHIGYTHVWDSIRYGPVVPQVCGPQTSTPGLVNWEAPGTLKQIVGLGSKDNRRYLTRDDANFRDLLVSNLDPKVNPLMIKDYIDPDPKNPSLCPRGPENEESFTPLIHAVENPEVMNGPNAGFRRDGAFFVAIIISDAKDESVNRGLDPASVVKRLAADTGEVSTDHRRFRIFSVAISPGTVIGCTRRKDGTCTPDPGVCLPDPAFADNATVLPSGHTTYSWPRSRVVKEDENPLVTAAQLTEDDGAPNSQVLSICAPDYGNALAKYGFQIQQDTLKDMRLVLPSRPQEFDATNPDYAAKHLKVYIGTIELAQGTQWDYDSNHPSITVYGQRIDWSKFPNEKIRVSYTPVDDAAATTKIIH